MQIASPLVLTPFPHLPPRPANQIHDYALVAFISAAAAENNHVRQGVATSAIFDRSFSQVCREQASRETSQRPYQHFLPDQLALCCSRSPGYSATAVGNRIALPGKTPFSTLESFTTMVPLTTT